MQISAFSSKEIQATIVALKSFEPALMKQIRAANRAVILPIWQEAIRGNVTDRFQTRVLSDTARVSMSSQNVRLSSASVGRALSGGLKPSELSHTAEFGANREATKSYVSHSSRGRAFTVKNRHTRRQFKPRNLKGYAVYPAAAKVIPRIASLWVQTTIRTFHEIVDKR